MAVLVRRGRRYIVLAIVFAVSLATALFVLSISHPGNQKPAAPRTLTASFIFSPSSATANQTVAFAASASGGTLPYGYSWSFGDGSGETGSSATHNYTSAGTFTVILTVKDSGSPQEAATAQQIITVANSTPLPPPSAPEIKISYSYGLNGTLDPSGIRPSTAGDVFLVVHLTIENVGYQNFTAEPFRDMYIVVGTNVYNVGAVYILPGVGDAGFPISINLNNTQSASGDVVFEVPQGSTSFTPGWRLLAGEQIRFDWEPIS